MQALVDRFFRYSSISSQSDEHASCVPSTPGQRELAELLCTELKQIGASAHIDEHSILYAKLPGKASLPSVGFCAHLDTIDVGLSPIIRPQILRYLGEDLDLGAAVFKASEHPEAAPYIGEEIIFSSGDSVLGADDKAAISTIMQLFSEQANNPNRGDLLACFVPDEEIGLRGSKIANLEHFSPDFAYTIDCCAKGELVYETFNAASAKLHISGVSAHPMSAKGVMINPITLCMQIAALLDPDAVPERTECREGYIWLNAINGNQNTATASFNIRDHCAQKFAERKKELQNAVAKIAAANPRAKCELEISDTYANIKDALNEHNKDALDRLFRAFSRCNIEPNVIPMRGGTDGSALAARGLFMPNFFTGAHNFHSRFEFLPLSSFEASLQIARALVDPAL